MWISKKDYRFLLDKISRIESESKKYTEDYATRVNFSARWGVDVTAPVLPKETHALLKKEVARLNLLLQHLKLEVVDEAAKTIIRRVKK